MQKFLVFFLILLFSFNSFADKVILNYKGVDGIWFDENTATRILEDVTELKLLKDEKIPKLEMKIELQELKISQLKLNVDITEKISDKYKSALENSEKLRIAETKGLRDELSKEQSWYKSPTLIFVLGFILGGAACVGISYSLHQ